MNRAFVAFALSLALPGACLEAQQAVHSGWPNVNRPVEIGPGDSVQLLNRILVDRGPGMRPVRRLDYQIRTTIGAGDTAARAALAARVAEALSDDAKQTGARMVSVAICDTEGCAKRSEPPRVWYIFERGPGGVWQRVHN